jgi:hypothetical protein
MANNNTSAKDTFLRGIAVLGLIAVLLLGAWGIIQLAVNLPAIFGGVGSSISSVFNGGATTTPAAVSPAATTSSPGTKPTVTTTSNVSSAARSNLFGYPDLAVRIISVNPVYGGRTNVTFEVANYGTNVAPKNWSFVAELPLYRDDSWPYYSAGQIALYPGDRIVYTLGFDEGDYANERDCEWDNRRDRWECNDDDDRRHNNDAEVAIIVDPYNQVFEANERNNEVRIEL